VTNNIINNITNYNFFIDREDILNIKNKNDVCLKYKHADLNDILAYLKYNIYPLDIKHKNAKSNFRKQCKPFIIEKDALVYKKNKSTGYI
jgi:hypothetical protein